MDFLYLETSRIHLENIESNKIFKTDTDAKHWMRFPFINGFLRVAVIPKSDLKISLSAEARNNQRMIVISLGYLNNMRSAIGTVEYPYSVEKVTPNILRRGCNEFLIFWLRGEVHVLKAGESQAFILMKYKQYPIHYVGFNTPNASAEWYLRENEKIISPISNHFIYHGIRKGYMEFAFKGAADARIALLFLDGCIRPPMVEIRLGMERNTKSLIRIDNNDYNQTIADTPDILSSDKFRIFCLQWGDGRLTIRKDHPHGTIIIESTARCVDFVPHYFAVRSGPRVFGKWIFGLNNTKTVVGSDSLDDARYIRPEHVQMLEEY